MEAGAIPVIFEQLRRWSSDAKVVLGACIALYNLVIDGSVGVMSAICCVPDHEALLTAARASGLAGKFQGKNNAAFILEKLAAAKASL